MLPQKTPSKSKGKQPGLVDPKNWNTLIDYIEALKAEIISITPRSGPDIGVRQTKGGAIMFLKSHGAPGESEVSTAPFERIFTKDEKTMLLGGVVSGGDGNVIVPDIVLWDGVGPSPSNGQYHYLICNFQANLQYNLLLPGGNATSVTEQKGSSIPSNQMPISPSGVGFVNIPLGVWSSGKFLPEGGGNFALNHCIGNLSYRRIRLQSSLP